MFERTMPWWHRVCCVGVSNELFIHGMCTIASRDCKSAGAFVREGREKRDIWKGKRCTLARLHRMRKKRCMKSWCSKPSTMRSSEAWKCLGTGPSAGGCAWWCIEPCVSAIGLYNGRCEMRHNETTAPNCVFKSWQLSAPQTLCPAQKEIRGSPRVLKHVFTQHHCTLI